jgi:hypothetical protein
MSGAYSNHIRPNQSTDEVVAERLAERERMQVLELCGWWMIAAFLALMNIGAIRLVWSMVF